MVNLFRHFLVNVRGAIFENFKCRNAEPSRPTNLIKTRIVAFRLIEEIYVKECDNLRQVLDPYLKSWVRITTNQNGALSFLSFQPLLVRC